MRNGLPNFAAKFTPSTRHRLLVAVISCSKRSLDDKGDAIDRFAGDRAVTKSIVVGADAGAELAQMSLADNAEIARLDRAAVSHIASSKALTRSGVDAPSSNSAASGCRINPLCSSTRFCLALPLRAHEIQQ